MFSQPSRESRFRIQAPNSSARDILVIPLDEASDGMVSSVAGESWKNVRFVFCSSGGTAWRAALTERRPDLVVVIGQAGGSLGQVIAIGEVCLEHHIKVSGLLIKNGDAGLLSSSLRSFRPWTQTLAVISDKDYLSELLHALGA